MAIRAAVGVLALVLAACGADVSSPSADGTPAGDSNGTSAGDSSVTVAVSSLAGAGQDNMSVVSGRGLKPYFDEIFDFVIIQDQSGALVPGLAEEWSVSEDGLTWTFQIREGVKFHNGDTLTPEDVAWSWNRLMFDPQSVSDLVGPGQNLTGPVEAVDNTVVLTTKTPIADVPIWFASTDGASVGVVLPKTHFEEVGAEAFFRQPVGTGPYELVTINGEESVELRAFVDDERSEWQNSRTAQFTNVTLVAAPDSSTRIAQLRTGEVDLAPVPLSGAQDLADASIDTIEVQSASNSLMWCVGFTLNTGSPCDDERVREALSVAIDRQAIAESVYGGLAEPSAAWPTPPGGPGYPEGLSAPEYDPDRAASLLAEAGFGPDAPLSVTIVAYDDDADTPMMPTLAEAITGYYQDIGVEATVQLNDWEAMKTDLFEDSHPGQRTNPETEPVTLWMRGMDQRFFFNQDLISLFTANGPQGAAIWENTNLPEQQERLEAFTAEFDMAAQLQLLADYYSWMAENYNYIPLISANSLFGKSDKIAAWDAQITGKSAPHNLWSLVPSD